MWMPRSAQPDTRVHDALRRIGPLPVLSGTVARIRTLAEDPNGTTSDLVAVIESDEAFAANLLRYANSAANARPIRARTIRQAVTLLGRRALVRIALEAATYRFLERFPGGAHLSRGQLHVHAVTVAAYAYTTAELRGAQTDTAHLAGLLHDVGKLLMPAAFGVVVLEEIASEAPAGADRAALERRRLGLDHAAAGALLVGLSEPDDAVTRAIAYHHGGPTGLACADARGRLRPDRRLDRAPARGQRDRPRRCSRSRSSASMPGRNCSTRSPRRPASRPPAPPPISPRPSAGSRPSRSTDDLTGLLNRRGWTEAVRRELAAGTEGAVIICDVDGFKHLNDTHGHRAGDLVLTEVARVLARHGVAGRLGGDEFGVWVREDEEAAARRRRDRRGRHRVPAGRARDRRDARWASRSASPSPRPAAPR